MLTRELISTGAYLESFQELPEQFRWSRERIEASMRETLARRPQPEEPVWVFAYGSLIWNPLFHFDEKQRATLHGWHRSFCIRLVTARGTSTHPGRMLGLELAGESVGVAFRLREDDLVRELMMVWVREMVGGVYQPTWGEITLADGKTVSAITFVADTAHTLYEDDSSIATTAPMIATANGHLGSNRDYLLRLDESLLEHDIADDYVKGLAEAVRAHRAAA